MAREQGSAAAQRARPKPPRAQRCGVELQQRGAQTHGAAAQGARDGPPRAEKRFVHAAHGRRPNALRAAFPRARPHALVLLVGVARAAEQANAPAADAARHDAERAVVGRVGFGVHGAHPLAAVERARHGAVRARGLLVQVAVAKLGNATQRTAGKFRG
jgi:hypothetical protein